MHAQVGVIREAHGLSATHDWIAAAGRRLGWARALTTASLIVAAAQARRESRGGHYRSDFPQTDRPQRSFVRLGPNGGPMISHADQDKA